MIGSEEEHTFVIMAYKESKYLEDCIKSLINQSVQSRILICTSTLNDHIKFLAKKYGIEIRTNENAGTFIGKDWNFALQCADTRYVTLAHQDDVYLNNFAGNCIKVARENASSKPLIVFNKSLILLGEKKVLVSFKNIVRWLLIFPFHLKRCIASKKWKRFILLFSNSISCPGVFYVKENLGDFKFDERDSYALDWQAWFDLSQHDGAFIYVPKVLHIHREHEESTTSTTQVDTLRKEEFNMLYKIWGNKVMPRIIIFFLQFAKQKKTELS